MYPTFRAAGEISGRLSKKGWEISGEWWRMSEMVTSILRK